MKNTKSIAAIALMLTAGATIFFSACKKKETETPPPTNPSTPSTDITYNAAYVVNGGSNSISVIDLSTNQVKRTIPLSNAIWPHHIYLNPAKTQIAIAISGMDLSAGHSNLNTNGMTGQFIVIDAKTSSVLKAQNLPMMNHNAVFSPNGSEIWTTQMDSMGTVLVYDAISYTLKNSINVGVMPAEVTFSSDGSMGFVANGGSNTVTVINTLNKNVMTTMNVGTEPVGAWQGGNNKMYVDNEMGQTISVIDVSTMMVEETVTLGFMPGMAGYNETMNELWVTDPDNGKVHYWTRGSNMWVHGGEITTGAGAHGVAFNGMTAYITNQAAGTVSIVSVMNHNKTLDITVGTKPNGIIIRNN